MLQQHQCTLRQVRCLLIVRCIMLKQSHSILKLISNIISCHVISESYPFIRFVVSSNRHRSWNCFPATLQSTDKVTCWHRLSKRNIEMVSEILSSTQTYRLSRYFGIMGSPMMLLWVGSGFAKHENQSYDHFQWHIFIPNRTSWNILWKGP